MRVFSILLFITLLVRCNKPKTYFHDCHYKMHAANEVLVTSERTVRFENNCPNCDSVFVYRNNALFTVLHGERLHSGYYAVGLRPDTGFVYRFYYKPEKFNDKREVEGFYLKCLQL